MVANNEDLRQFCRIISERISDRTGYDYGPEDFCPAPPSLVAAAAPGAPGWATLAASDGGDSYWQKDESARQKPRFRKSETESKMRKVENGRLKVDIGRLKVDIEK